MRYVLAVTLLLAVGCGHFCSQGTKEKDRESFYLDGWEPDGSDIWECEIAHPESMEDAG